jgi:hypothetical protein
MRLLTPLSAPDDYNSFTTYLPDFGLVGSYIMNVYSPSYFQEEYGRYIFIKTGTDSFGTRVNVAKLDVPELHHAGNFRITPNPANDQLTIIPGTGSGSISVAMRNMQGQTVFQQNFRGQKLSLSTAHIPAGLYFLELRGTDFRQVEKVLIRH